MKVALITLHGMGKVKPLYFSELEARLKRGLGTQWGDVSFQNVQYGEILQTPEETLWNSMNQEPTNQLDAIKLRQFFLYGFGDAASLEHSAQTDKIEGVRNFV